MNFIKHFDFLGQEFGFKENGKSRHVTYQGIIISSIIFIAILIISALYGKEIFERRKPKVTFSKESKQSKIFLKNFEYFFFFENSYGNAINNYENHLDIEITLFTFKNGERFIKSLEYEKCDFLKFNNPKALLVYSNLKGAKCIKNSDKEDDYIDGKAGHNNSSFLRIMASTCNPQDTNRKIPCLLSAEFFEQIVLFVNGFVTSYLNPSSYEKPINHYIDIDYNYIAPNQSKSGQYFMTEDIFISDYGWILERNIDTVTYNLFKYVKDIDFSLWNNFGSGLKPGENLFTFTIEVETISNRVTRSYLKVQELIASLGGISNGLFFIAKLIFQNYFRFLHMKQIKENCLNGHQVSEISKFFL